MSNRRHPRGKRRCRNVAGPSLYLEHLETRLVPAVTSLQGVLAPAAAHDTLDQAATPGDLTVLRQAQATGTIGTTAASGEVDWYSFQLDAPSRVTLAVRHAPTSATFASVLSL